MALFPLGKFSQRSMADSSGAKLREVELQDLIRLSCCTVVRTGINLNVILTLERDRRTAGMWQAKSKPQAIVINERLKKVRFH